MGQRFLNYAKNNLLGDLTGAFADGAILFPLIVTLSSNSGFSGSLLLKSSGIAYILAGLYFKVPMSIQPLKSVAIAAITIGASSYEVRIAGLLLALFCLSASFFDVNSLAKKVPAFLVHGIQLGLGVMLVTQGLRIIWKADLGLIWMFSIFAFAMIIVGKQKIKSISLLGGVATVGMVIAMIRGSDSNELSSSLASSLASSQQSESIRWTIVWTLALPQLALTLANSVLATNAVSHRYFGEKAKKVAIRSLMMSIGFGNVCMAAIGGLPYCHGAGGVTAHYRAGARTFMMNIMIGSFLVVCGYLQGRTGQSIILYPSYLLAVLLIATGIFHGMLAEDSWLNPTTRKKIALMAMTAIVSQNILFVLIVGLGLLLIRT